MCHLIDLSGIVRPEPAELWNLQLHARGPKIKLFSGSVHQIDDQNDERHERVGSPARATVKS
jgi:hypothetical protein